MSERKRKPMPKHWYKFYVGECPVCGSWKGFKVRVLGTKPSDPTERYIHLAPEICFDNCIY